MGKALLLIMTGVMVVGVMATTNVRTTQRATDVAVTDLEADVLARQIAQSALNTRVAQVHQNLLGAGSISAITNQASQGGAFDVSSRLVNGYTAEVTATGRFGGKTVQLKRTLMMVSPLDAAILLETPDANVVVGGSGTYLADGRDTRPASGTVDPNANFDKPGLKASNATVAARVGLALYNRLGWDGMDRVYGRNPATGTNGRADQGGITAGAHRAQIQAIFDEARLHPNRQSVNLSSLGNTTYGTSSAPVVVVRDGDLTVTGTVTGYGVLVVNGDLRVSGAGALRWEGLVMAKSRTETDNLDATIGGNTVIHGAVVLLQGSSAFTMPVDGRVRVRYVSSNAGLKSSVYLHPYSGVAQQIAPPGSNRNGDRITPVVTNFIRGQQMNFYIGVHRCTGNSANCGSNTPTVTSELYKHWARGYNAQNSGKPYAYVTQRDPYLWRIAFEDIDEVTSNGLTSTTPDWDYDKPGQEDQVIEVEVQCRKLLANGTQSATEYEKCTPNHPETETTEVPLTAAMALAVPALGAGNRLNFTLQENARVYYSAEAISRVGALLSSVRNETRIVVLGDVAL